VLPSGLVTHHQICSPPAPRLDRRHGRITPAALWAQAQDIASQACPASIPSRLTSLDAQPTPPAQRQHIWRTLRPSPGPVWPCPAPRVVVRADRARQAGLSWKRLTPAGPGLCVSAAVRAGLRGLDDGAAANPAPDRAVAVPRRFAHGGSGHPSGVAWVVISRLPTPAGCPASPNGRKHEPSPLTWQHGG
jgi:hypothetical protein